MNWKDGEYEPKQRRADEKKQRIVESAYRVFSEKGYHGASTKEIAGAAGVATGSFYRYFRDKKAVFMAVCHRMEAEVTGRVFDFGEQLRSRGVKGREFIRNLVEFSVRVHCSGLGFHREMMALEILDPDVGRWAAERDARIKRRLLEFMEPMAHELRVTDLPAAMELMFATIEEVTHMAVIFESEIGEERLVRELADMLSRYLFEE